MITETQLARRRLRGFGDPQQQFIWWPQWTSSELGSPGYANAANGIANTGRNFLGWWKPRSGDWHWYFHKLKWSGTYAWHTLDMAAGIDLGTEDGVAFHED